MWGEANTERSGHPQLTVDQLISAGACEKSVARFRRNFGESVDVTPERTTQFSLFFNWECAASKLLTEAQEKIFLHLTGRAYKEYLKTKNLHKWQRLSAAAWALAYESV